MRLASPTAWAVHKCKDAQGRTVYQERPCAGEGTTIDATPATGYSPAPTAATAATPSTPTAKKEGPFGERWQRMTYLRNRGVPDARAHLSQHHHDCDAKMRALEAQKNQANNNLAGATWVQSISTQMQAEATMCASRATLLQNHKDKLEQELRDLEATNP